MKAASALIFIVLFSVSGALFPISPDAILAASNSLASQDSAGGDTPMQTEIVSKEREGLEALKTGDLERFGDLTSEDAIMVDDHGPATKAQVLKNVAGFSLTSYTMQDVRFVPISPDAGLISYKIIESGLSHGRQFTAQAYISSIWAKRANKWVCLFSQETATR